MAVTVTGTVGVPMTDEEIDAAVTNWLTVRDYLEENFGIEVNSYEEVLTFIVALITKLRA